MSNKSLIQSFGQNSLRFTGKFTEHTQEQEISEKHYINSLKHITLYTLQYLGTQKETGAESL